MLAHWFSGRRARALAAYGRLRQVLVDQLGDDPAHESQEPTWPSSATPPDRAQPRSTTTARSSAALLRLLRQALDDIPGVRAPARDAALSEVAMLALAGVG